uniref:Uncharacterized protein n=1 Tax=Oryza punctata TaxID=4537 RepID=A0A0E0KJG0_ORYPU
MGAKPLAATTAQLACPIKIARVFQIAPPLRPCRPAGFQTAARWALHEAVVDWRSGSMSSLIDIWTVERERMRVSGAQAFRTTVASIGGSTGLNRGCTARSDGGQNKPDGAAVEKVAKKQQAAAVGGAPASVVQEDAFLSILIDCFGQ